MSSASHAAAAECSIGTALALHERLLAASRDGRDLTLDVGAVTSADVTFVQLAVSAARTLDAAGLSFALGNVTP